MSRRSRELDLLPSNALGAERALSRSTGFGDDILPEDIRKLWNAREAASRFLSFMAWGLHVDFWEDDFPEPLKRSLIEGSFAWHRKKGTRWSIQEILRFLNVDTEVQEWQEYGGRPYTFRVKAIVRHPLHPCESWGQETYKRIHAAIFETKPLRAWLDDLTIKILFDFGDITLGLGHSLRRELRTARAFWSLWPRFDFVDADAMPLDWNPWSALRRELRTARASRGLTGVSHLDRLLRFDSIDADFLPMDIAMPYFEADTPPILVPFRWRVHRTARGSATFEASGTQGIAHRRRAFAGAALGFSGMFSGSRMAMGSPSEAPCGLDRYVGFDGIPADFAPLDCAIPYREGERRWGAT